MKRLFLLRHAKAVPAEGAASDIARPLAERGERDAHRIGERLHRQLGTPDLILASTATRTLQTARVVAVACDYPQRAIALDERLYLATPAILHEVIASQDAGLERLLLVGHNPGLTELAHALLPSFDVVDLPTAAVVAIEYADLADWTSLTSAAGRLSYYDFPKNTREPATAR